MVSRFNLYTRNNLESLAQCYSEARKESPLDFRRSGVFGFDEVTVPTRGMAVWLEHYLVNDGHVVANYKFPFVRNSIDNILRECFVDVPAFKPKLFAVPVLTWRIYSLLLKDSGKYNLTSYLNRKEEDVTDLRRYQLSLKLANLFYQYQSFLPFILHPVKNERKDVDENNRWQMDLWDDLCVDENGEHIISPAEAMVAFLTNDALLKEVSPVTFFGVSAMPPVFLQILKKLAKNTTVNFFYHNPCDEYWAEQQAEWEKKHYSAAEDNLSTSFENSLLGNFGIQGRNFFKAIMELDSDICEHSWVTGPCKNEKSSTEQPILKAIQANILAMETPEESSPLGDWDDSLTVHSCFNEMREVEALHDSLLKLIQERKYAMTDIIVMAPDISEFAPAIRAVFDNGPLKKNYSITDRTLRSANLLADAFLSILSIGGTNFEVSILSHILESVPLRKRFGIDNDSAVLINKWLLMAGIRWGKDSRSRKDEKCLLSEEYTWRYGLDRLLLTLAVEPDEEMPMPGFGDLLPVPFATSEENATLLGNLCRFFTMLCDFSNETAKERTPHEWCELLRKMQADFFMPDSDSAMDYAILSASINNLDEACALSPCGSSSMPFSVIRGALEESMGSASPNEPFLNGKLTFCSMLPMRGVPCKVIAILGMDEGVFPRTDEKIGFSLMNNASLLKYYDRSRSIEDRYIFLEAILAAQDYLMIFYHGRDDKRLNELLPSSVVTELLEYASRVRTCMDGKKNRLVVEHRLNAFDPMNFRRNGIMEAVHGYTGQLRTSFSYDNASAVLASYTASGDKTSTLLAGMYCLEMPGDLHLPGSGEKLELDIGHLAYFLKSPAQYFLEHRLGFPKKEWEDEDLTDFEPYSLSSLEDAVYKRKIGAVVNKMGSLPSFNKSEEMQSLYESMRADCGLPISEMGKLLFIQKMVESWINKETFRKDWKSQQEVEVTVELPDVEVGLSAELISVLKDALKGGKECDDVDRQLDVELNKLVLKKTEERTQEDTTAVTLNVSLTGKFDAIPGGGVRYATFSTLHGRHLIQPYLQHLMLCASGHNEKDNSSVIDKDEALVNLPYVPEGIAKEYLTKLVSMYVIGRFRPLPLFANVSPMLVIKLPSNAGDKDTKLSSAARKDFSDDLSDTSTSMLFQFTSDDAPKKMVKAIIDFGRYCYGGLSKKDGSSTKNTAKGKGRKK